MFFDKKSSSEAASSTDDAAKALSTANYTARVRLESVQSERDDHKTPLVLAPHRHFTLGCTEQDEVDLTTKAFDRVAEYLNHEPLQLTAKRVQQFGPNWGVELDIPEDLRSELSQNFDPKMSKDGGILYLWDLESRPDLKVADEADKPVLKTPHMSIGPTNEHREIAERLVHKGYTMTFNLTAKKRTLIC